MPVPPAIMVDPAERAAYIAGHYWQGLDYADTAWLADSAALEQVFVQWIALLVQQPAKLPDETVAAVISCGNDHPLMQLRLFELAEHYFNNPNSPYRSEELYIPILKAVISAPAIDSLYKVRPCYQLESAMKNRPGTKAADFAFTTREGRTQRLAEMPGDYLLLYFFNPDCRDCKRVAAYIAESPVFSDARKQGSLSILAIYPDEDMEAWTEHAYGMPAEWIVGRYANPADREAYDLPAIPTLYLLDRNKNVLLKDRPVEQIEGLLSAKTNP